MQSAFLVPFYRAWDLFQFDKVDVSLIFPQVPKFVAMVSWADRMHSLHLLSIKLSSAPLQFDSS